jgi:hypothetical protein
MATTQTARDDSVIRERVPTRVRFLVQSRPPQKARGGPVKDTSYSQVSGHARVVEIRTLREFRRLWKAIEQVIDQEDWRDVRRIAAASELPAAGAPVDVVRP